MRYSKQREQILKIVRSSGTHPTADWVYREVRKRIPNISLGTVYRNLKQLVENRQIQAREIDGVAHYDGNLEDHQHFHCNCCHRIFDLELSVGRLLSRVKTKLKHDVQAFDLQVNGVCKTCQHKIGKGEVEQCL